MGQFSWLATDTGEQILNDKYKGFQTVKMVYKDKEGNQQVAVEDDYEGYGVFGGVDYYDAVVWMNSWYKPDYTPDELRSKGIDLYFEDHLPQPAEYPQLFLGDVPEVVDFRKRPDDDPNQGWSRGEEEEDYEYDDEEFEED